MEQHTNNELPVGMGHGVAGRYGGLPEEFSNLDTSKIVILPVPFDKTTTYQKGSDLGPEALIEASRNMELYDIETDCEVYQLGIHTAPPAPCSSSEEMIAGVQTIVAELLKKDKFVVTIGGEHSISPAPIRAYAERFPGMSVLQLDAHADLQPAYEGNPLSHASAMSRVKENRNVANLVAVGIRSMSIDELKFMEPSLTYFAHDIWEGEDWMERVVGALSDKVYITLDLDVFDPSIMPSTGTPEPGGLGWYQVLRLLKLVSMKKTVVGFDIVELCPKAGDKSPDFLAAKLIYKMLSYIFAKNLIKG
jgi:agmatinase